MPVRTLRQESLAQAGFYVPRFEVVIERVGLPRDVLRDVVQVTYNDNIHELDGFELTVNNWNPATNSFKYVGSETARALQEDTVESQRYHLFEPSCREVSLRMGYMGNLNVMVTGNFTTMEPTFPSSGAPTLTVRGLNVLQQLRTKPYTDTWEHKKDSDIAERISGLNDPETGKKRFPLPIVTNSTARRYEPTLVYLAQSNKYDLDFLLERAYERGYVVFIQEADPALPGSQRRLYFGPSDGTIAAGLRDTTYKLEWGKSLIDFKPTLSTANLVSSVTVKGWNRQTRHRIEEEVTLDDPRVTRNRDLFDLLVGCNRREKKVVNEPVHTENEARERALALLDDQLKEAVKASATTIGLPMLRAGQRVQIAGLGSRFSGTYFITDTTHTINDSGYLTRFNARRENGGQGDAG